MHFLGEMIKSRLCRNKNDTNVFADAIKFIQFPLASFSVRVGQALRVVLVNFRSNMLAALSRPAVLARVASSKGALKFVSTSLMALQTSPPTMFLSSDAKAGSAPAAAAGGEVTKQASQSSDHESRADWVKSMDPANGLPFWYNKVTMEHRDTEPAFAKYDELVDTEAPSDVQLARGTDGRMWEA